ncbi:Histamine H2 receptor [Trichoplax sp. H2]|nr:Histamine H2 receptor [Trichoplax sp. H2]|eukprot:RDD44231.1 Histamine H2 receptor [Trichoplax sp. H2]
MNLTELCVSKIYLDWMPVVIESILIFVTNGPILLFIMCRRRLRTRSMCVMASSAICSIIFGCFYLVKGLLNMYCEFHSKPILCTIIQALEWGLASIFALHVTLISLERYFAIAYPFKYQRLATPCRLAFLLAIIWLFPLLIMSLPMILYDFSHGQICLNWSNDPIFSKIFTYFLVLMLSYFPPFAILLTYSGIICILQHRARRVHAIEYVNQGFTQRIAKVLIQMLLMTGIYVTLTSPFAIFSITISTENSPTLLKLSFLTYFLAIFYLIVHPFLCAYFTANLKDEIGKRFRTSFAFFNRSTVEILPSNFIQSSYHNANSQNT